MRFRLSALGNAIDYRNVHQDGNANPRWSAPLAGSSSHHSPAISSTRSPRALAARHSEIRTDSRLLCSIDEDQHCINSRVWWISSRHFRAPDLNRSSFNPFHFATCRFTMRPQLTSRKNETSPLITTCRFFDECARSEGAHSSTGLKAESTSREVNPETSQQRSIF